MSEYWQIAFRVKGLRVPTENILFDNILVKGISPSDNAFIIFKVKIQNEAEKDIIPYQKKQFLKNILQMYGLITGMYVEPPSGYSMGKISPERPFGDSTFYGKLKGMVILLDEQRRKGVFPLRKSIDKLTFIEKLSMKRNISFLKNAIDYYYRSLGDNMKEEKLIDLMISLESLFSLERQELRLRYSLRTSLLLSIGQESNQSKIFELIYDMYDLRSKVVHGTSEVKLNDKKIRDLEYYIGEAIKRFLYIDISKKNLLRLIDEAVYNDRKRRELNLLVLEAINKW